MPIKNICKGRVVSVPVYRPPRCRISRSISRSLGPADSSRIGAPAETAADTAFLDARNPVLILSVSVEISVTHKLRLKQGILDLELFLVFVQSNSSVAYQVHFPLLLSLFVYY
jgi:hypothetical protein